MTQTVKPLGGKNYGSIPHLPGSRMGPGDHHCHTGQEVICTTRVRDKHDFIIVQEKLDGSNVGIAKINGKILSLNRAGYEATTSPYEQHHRFAAWVREHYQRFDALLRDGERVVGEWILQAHGTRYRLKHEPFVAFDLMRGTDRLPYEEFVMRAVGADLIIPKLIHAARTPLAVDAALFLLGEFGHHGAIDPVEGAVWRVERDELIAPQRGSERRRVVDFLAKYVRPDKQDGKFLESVTGQPSVWNT